MTTSPKFTRVRLAPPYHGWKDYKGKLITKTYNPTLSDLSIVNMTVRDSTVVVINHGYIRQTEPDYRDVQTDEIIPGENTVTPVENLLLLPHQLKEFNLYAVGTQTGVIKEQLRKLLQ